MAARQALDVHLLGGFRLTRGNELVVSFAQARLQFLLAYLLLNRDALISRQQLALVFWPDTTDEQARSNLRTLLHRLFEALPDIQSLLVLDRHTLRWRDDAVLSLDVADFAAALARAKEAEQAGDRAAAKMRLQEALTAYGGDLLPACYDDWVLPIREQLAQSALRASERLVLLLEEDQAYGAALDHVHGLLRYDPMNESTYCHMMRLQALCGDRVGVVRTFKACAAVLHRELAVQPSTETRAAYDQALRRAAAPAQTGNIAPAPRQLAQSNLPQPASRLIGRDADTAQVHQLLADHRLVTFTGSGGVGKTRLALHVARMLQPDFPDGAWWIDLEPVTDETLVSRVVADTLGVGESAGPLMTQALTTYLANKHLLLVLDNCEHLSGRVGQLARDLLRLAPQVRILVTSQQALSIPEETVWRVPSLHFPLAPPSASAGRGGSAEDLLAALQGCEEGSIQLFVERAQAVLPTFSLTAANAADVSQVCRRLDGIPLAIELAAARVRMLTPQDMAGRLDDALSLLASQAAGIPARRQTLRATLDWSYAQLSQQERVLFGRLAVFSGSFSLEAVEAICSGCGILPEQVLDLLAGLEDKSFVESVAGHLEIRFRLHEIIRQYAARKLAEADDARRMQARHLDFYRCLLAEIEPKLTGPEQAAWLDRLEAEHDNLRAALAFSLTPGVCIEAGLAIGGGLQRLWRRAATFTRAAAGQRPWSPRLPPCNQREHWPGRAVRPATWLICKETTPKRTPTANRRCALRKS